MVDDTRNCDDVGAYLEEDLPRAAGRGAGHPHQEQRRDLRSRLGQEQGRAGAAAQAVQRDRRLEVALQGHRLGAGAQGGLGRAQRHHHRRPARLRRQEQHPAGADARARPAPDVLRHRRAGDRVRHGHARVHGLRRVDPERRRHASSTCRWAAGATRHGLARRRSGHREPGQGPRRARHRAAQAHAPLPPRLQGSRRARSRRRSATRGCRSSRSPRRRRARSSSRLCSTRRSTTPSSSMAPGRPTTARSSPSSRASC